MPSSFQEAEHLCDTQTSVKTNDCVQHVSASTSSDAMLSLQRQTTADVAVSKVSLPLSSLTNYRIKCPFSNGHIMLKTFDHNGGMLTSKCGDLRITIPGGAIGIGDDVIICASTSLYGPFELPVHSQTDMTTARCSPYYWIGVSGTYHFYKPIQVEFEHFGACDPSHYQLLTCEDDDKSYTMRPVDYELSFTVRDDMSLCTFQSYHCCSYCLFHDCKDHVGLNKIAALYLKPADLVQHYHFRVQIWFSLHTSLCLKRTKELYTSRGLVLDKDCTSIFSSSSDKTCENYFDLSYERSVGWYIWHFRFERINTKDVNFCNSYTNMEDLKEDEENSIFPPRFILNVTKNSKCNHQLNSKIKVTLFNKEMKSTDCVFFELFVPISPSIRHYTTDVSSEHYPIPSHQCKQNKPELPNLIKYSNRIVRYWKEIAAVLGIQGDIAAIDTDNSRAEEKCLDMFTTWLQRKVNPCWCHFIQALHVVGLDNVAEEVITNIVRLPITETVQSLETDVQEELIPAERLKPAEHLKLLEIESVSTSDLKVKAAQTNLELETSVQSSTSEGSSEIVNNGLNLYNLMRYLKDIPDDDLDFFIYKLLPKSSAVNVIKDIKHNSRSLSKKDKIKKVCDAFLTVENPSWTEVCRALEDAESPECNDLASIVEVTFLTKCM